MWKTQRLSGFVDKIANIFPWFWKWFMNVGIVISFGAMITIAYMLISSLSTIFEAPSVSLLIPGVEIPGSIFIPFGYGIIALATVLIVHEFSHGILARREKVSIKSIGLLLFAILPGAFVEPDEEEIKNIKRIPRMRIFAAGSIANISFALVALLIFMLISSVAIPATFQEGDGVKIDRVIEGDPAYDIVKSGMIIKSINGHKVSDANSYYEAVLTLKPGDMVNIVTDQGTYNFTAGTNPNNKSLGYMGIQAVVNLEVKSDVANVIGNQLPWALFSLARMFLWIHLLNLAIGLFNLLPMKPLDGGYLLEDLLGYILPENVVSPIITLVSWFFIFIIAISLIAGFGLF
jgi:membrane-associated protease RseP (regulator of RpoE activity)